MREKRRCRPCPSAVASHRLIPNHFCEGPAKYREPPLRRWHSHRMTSLPWYGRKGPPARVQPAHGARACQLTKHMTVKGQRDAEVAAELPTSGKTTRAAMPNRD